MPRLLLLCLLLVASPAFAQPAVIDVIPDSPVGDPLAARDAARQMRQAGEKRPITVRFADGVYPLSEPVVFEPQDSHVTYEAAPGARPAIVGGKKIGGFVVRPDGLWSTTIPEARDGKWRFEALWVGEQRATRARTPNEGFWDAVAQPKDPLPDLKMNGDAEHVLLQIKPEHAAELKDLTREELFDLNFVAYHTWDVNIHRIAGVRLTDGVVQFTGGGAWPFFKPEARQRFHLENYKKALDAPGEWFLARDGVLLYKPRPGEKPETTEVWAPVATQWMRFQGDLSKNTPVADVHFRGLQFRYQGYTLPDDGAHFGQAESGLGAAIEANGLENASFVDCEFDRTTTNVAWFKRACHDVSMKKCHLHDLGAGGVKIGDPGVRDDGPAQTHHVALEDCIIHSGGRRFRAGIGVVIFHAHDCTVKRCDVGDLYYSAVSIGWTWGYNRTACARNVIEDCHLHHLGWQVLSDMAAVYTLGPQPDTIIRGCHIHDIAAATYGGWGMYNDEGSTGVVWENNLVHHVQDAGYHQHYGRGNVVRNNIIAYCGTEHVRRSRPEEFFAFSFERNIVLLGPGKLFAQNNANWSDGRVDCHHNVYWKPNRWKPGGGGTAFAGMNWADWRWSGQDAGSFVADPLFVDPEHGNWTLRPESPALKTGFVPFDATKAGVSGDDAWKQLAAKEFPAMPMQVLEVKPLALKDGFEETPLGGKPKQATQGVKKVESIAVVDDPLGRPADANAGEGPNHCLQLTDSPDTDPSFDPHFYYSPEHEFGVTRASFRVRAEPGFHLLHEWRDGAAPYHTGPAISIHQGALSVAGKKLLDLPADAWTKIEISAALGDDSTGEWSLVVTPAGQPEKRFDGLKFQQAEMRTLNWLGFIGAGRENARCWLDDVEIENTPK